MPRHRPGAFLAATLALSLACGPESSSSVDGDSRNPDGEGDLARARIEALGYAVRSDSDAEETGVVAHRPELASAGLNLFTSGHAPAAYLVDMEGDLLHTWRRSFQDSWPQRPIPKGDDWTTWRYAHPLGDGSLLAIFDGFGLIRVDRDSNLLWAVEGQIHHDIDVLPNGDIYTLAREIHVIPRVSHRRSVEDFVVILDASGKEKDRFSLLESWEGSDFVDELAAHDLVGGDLFHTNTLEVFDGSVSHLSPLFEKGNILTSFRTLDTIAIIDGATRRFVWLLSGDWGGQHYPTLLDDGRILLFANRDESRASSVEIIDPIERRVEWRYDGTPPRTFFSERCGGAQMLPNGNVLITESQFGRAFEVDSGGEIVWEYVNPYRFEDGGKIGYLFLMTRFAPERLGGWLRPGAAGDGRR